MDSDSALRLSVYSSASSDAHVTFPACSVHESVRRERENSVKMIQLVATGIECHF